MPTEIAPSATSPSNDAPDWVALARQRRAFEQAPGFILVLRGPEHVVEFVNETHHAAYGSSAWIGKTISDVLPANEVEGLVEQLDRVYQTGEKSHAQDMPVTYRNGDPGAPSEQRYLTFVYAPLRDEDGAVSGVFCEGFDATASKEARLQSDALLALSDVIREIDDPETLAYATTEILGKYFDVSRAGYGTINKSDETITIARDWNAPGIKSLAGTLHFRDYGSYIDELKQGITVVVSDADKDPRTAATANALKAISAASFVNMPVTEQGDFVPCSI